MSNLFPDKWNSKVSISNYLKKGISILELRLVKTYIA